MIQLRVGKLGQTKNKPTSMIDYNEVYIYNEQPVTCPFCGNRTEILMDFYLTPKKTQVHKCLSNHCNKEFLTQEDIE